MGNVRLVKPSLAYREAYMDFYEDWLTEGVEAIVPWVVEGDPQDFEAYVAFLYAADSEEKLTDDGFVPHSTYWLINEEEEIVGAVNIRHRLNQKLLESGGHIGYGIRPSRRGRGYASVQLAEALKVVKGMGIERVLLVCDHDNEASERTIRRAGGVLESLFTTDKGEVLKRFWIDGREQAAEL
ncbi:GNAT family N-acetyltransferase [Paenibacillus sp. 1011MAR3C5]|uniref:GNAT family N-acetyltransferase n=1 Tax=Paenibacillus sp. 1011MAR3C5 TaxID=1675787 RepID=UPI000E6C7821|nr:GNAT family N-acetyltransferase [Paenibacillus sp. 1011MAR3C5]RJE87618.1 GNAT family N-acetyltransferase [Paenibacillus sp. 1011MAR3C5]